MTLPANLRSNWRVPFPALVMAGAGIVITKLNGIWTISLAAASGGGALRTNTFLSAASYSASSTDQDILVNFNGAVAIALPPAASRVVAVGNLIVHDLGGFAGTGNITLTASGTDIFENGGTTNVLSVAFATRELKPVLVGAQWKWIVLR